MSKHRSNTLFACISALVLMFTTGMEPAHAQLGGLKKKIKAKVEQRVANRIDQTIDRGLDNVECIVTDSECIESAKANGKSVTVIEGAGALKPGQGVWANYDFVPGAEVLVAEDFTGDNVGDFPKRFELREGNAEIVEWNGQRWLSFPSFTVFEIPLPRELPKRFTIEFDYFAGETETHSQDPVLVFDPKDNPKRPASSHVNFDARGGAGVAGPLNSTTPLGDDVLGKRVTVRVMADGPHAKVYINERRVANAPNANFARADRLALYVPGWGGRPALIRNIRIAGGGKELYDALARDGRIAVHGILFDSGSDRIKPESTAALKQIGEMLKAHADLKLRIEGHTDNVGEADTNQTLSQKRAEAVKQHVVDTYGIDAARLEAQGFGASQPAADNTTAEGRQQNRRVELVKM